MAPHSFGKSKLYIPLVLGACECAVYTVCVLYQLYVIPAAPTAFVAARLFHDCAEVSCAHEAAAGRGTKDRRGVGRIFNVGDPRLMEVYDSVALFFVDHPKVDVCECQKQEAEAYQCYLIIPQPVHAGLKAPVQQLLCTIDTTLETQTSRVGDIGDIGVIGSRTVTLPHYFID